MNDKEMSGFKYIRCQILNKTLDEVAKMLGVTYQTVFSWESKKKKLPETRLIQLSEMTGLPTHFFLIENVTEFDKLEIKKHWLDREVKDTKNGYESILQNMEEYNDIASANMSMKANKLLGELRQLFNDSEEQEQVLELFDAFKRIATDNKQTDLLLSISKALELFFEAFGKGSKLAPVEDLAIRDKANEESDVVYEVYSSMVRCRRWMRDKENGTN